LCPRRNWARLGSPPGQHEGLAPAISDSRSEGSHHSLNPGGCVWARRVFCSPHLGCFPAAGNEGSNRAGFHSGGKVGPGEESSESAVQSVFGRRWGGSGEMPLRVGVGLILILTMGAPAWGQSLGIGKPAPELALTDLTGSTHRISDYRGNGVFLNFWATWCIPCRMEMSSIERAS